MKPIPAAAIGPDFTEQLEQSMTQNKQLWQRVCKTDPRHVKPITGKDYGGNSPKPYWIVERLTDEFGPCGIGWGYSIESERFERFSDTDVLHIAKVRLWYVADGKRGEIEQMGQTKACYVTSKGVFKVDEDAPKKSVTDALVKCASYLGFAGDIFSGRWDDSKYVNELRKEFAEKDKPEGIDLVPVLTASIAAEQAKKKRGGVVQDVLQESPEIPDEDRTALDNIASDIVDCFEGSRQLDAVTLYYGINDNHHKIYVWGHLDSKCRAFLKANNPHQQKAA